MIREPEQGDLFGDEEDDDDRFIEYRSKHPNRPNKLVARICGNTDVSYNIGCCVFVLLMLTVQLVGWICLINYLDWLDYGIQTGSETVNFFVSLFYLVGAWLVSSLIAFWDIVDCFEKGNKPTFWQIASLPWTFILVFMFWVIIVMCFAWGEK